MMARVDPVARNFLSTVSRCYFKAEGRGVLFFDPEEKQTTWVPFQDLSDEVRKQLPNKYAPYVIVRAQDGLLHVIEVNDPVVDIQPRGISVITVVPEGSEVSEITRYSMSQINYPSELIEWNVCSEKDLNDTIDRSTHSLIFHMEDGEYYFPDCLNVLLQAMGAQKSCVGCCSCLVYDPTTDILRMNFEDDLGFEAMKRGTMLYTKDFWDSRKWDASQNLSNQVVMFTKDRVPTSFGLVSPVDIMCFVERDIGYLQEIGNFLSNDVRDILRRLYRKE